MRYLITSIVLVIITALSVLPAQAQQNTPAFQALIDQAGKLYIADKNAEALELYQQALKQDPTSVQAQYGIALVYYTTAHYVESAAICAELVKRPEGQIDALYVTYGNALNRQPKHEEAVAVFQAGLQKFPQYEPLHRYLGMALQSLRRYPESAQQYQWALLFEPGKATTHYLLAEVEALSNHRMPALLACQAALVLEQDPNRAATRMGGLLYKLLRHRVKPAADNSVSVTLSQSLVDQSTAQEITPNDFAAVDLAFTLETALDYDEKNRSKAPEERLAEKLQSLFKSLQEQPEKRREGFFWQFYAPFFQGLDKASHTTTLAYLLSAYQPQANPEAKRWPETHQREVEQLRKWAAGHFWVKLK